MAVSVVRTGSSDRSSGTSKTFAFDASSGNFLIVSVNTYDDFSDTNGKVSGITYAGTSMTQAVESQGISGTRNWAQHFYLANPTTGSNNIVITMTGSTTGIAASATLFTSSGTSAVDSSNGSTSTGADSSLTITTNVANTIMVGISQSEVNAYTAEGGSQTSIAKMDSNFIWHSHKSATSSGSNTMTFNGSGSDRHCWAIVAIKEVTASIAILATAFMTTRSLFRS